MIFSKIQIAVAKLDSLKIQIAALFSLLLCFAATPAQAAWTPPESSVKPPAVLTLDAFSGPDWNGRNPSAPLVVGPDGALYGSTQSGGAGGYGTLFRLETNGALTKLHDFDDTDGYGPSALVVGPDGALYGSTSGGSAMGYGTLFRLATDGTYTKLHDFKGTDGYGPSALVLAPDGALYGSTAYGGSGSGGTLFRLGTNGAFTKLHDFNGTNGSQPYAALVIGPDDALYSSTYCGGVSNNGTLFRLETTGRFTKLHDFNGTNGSQPYAALVIGPDGALYGSTYYGGVSNNGTLFRLETTGRFTRLHDFSGTDGCNPSAALAVGPDGALYGSTYNGGTNDSGTLFRLETSGTFTKVHDFDGTDGYGPSALVVGPDGALYGWTPAIWDWDELHGFRLRSSGKLFRLETSATFTKLHDFDNTDAYGPSALVVGPDGDLYGSTEHGGSGNCGTLFRLATDSTFTQLHDFNMLTDGAYPSAALVVGPDGALYGSTPEIWGWDRWRGFPILLSYGTLFRVATDGLFIKLHHFNGTDGYGPSSALVVGPDGGLYGSTYDGGTDNQGTLFRLETNGDFTKLHDFNWTDGARPCTALVMGPDGALYGSTSDGGNFGGTLFRLETNGAFTDLHYFDYTDLPGRFAALVMGPDGALYGSTPETWTFGWGTWTLWSHGTLFRVETNGAFTQLHDFNGTNGSNPFAPLVVGPDGALYGSTYSGGPSGYGTLFRLTTDGTFTQLHDFNGTEGNPSAPLVLGPDGALYGSTAGVWVNERDGGSVPINSLGWVGSDTLSFGTLFRLETTGTFTKLHDFNSADGYGLSAALVMGPDGALYGSTSWGGISNNGTLFRLRTDGTFTKIYDFNGTNGAHPSAPLIVGPDGALYGSTQSGGPRGGGILFKLILNRHPVADPSATSTLVISHNGTNATLILNGSRSSDPDRNPLQYFWTLNSQPSNILASGVVSNVVLPVGAHTVQLVVNDGILSATNSVAIEVITTAQAVEGLQAAVKSEAPKPQSLLAILSAASASIARGNPVAASKQLRAFQNQLQAQLAPLDPALAASLIQFAAEIIEAIRR